MDYKIIGERIRSIRLKRQITQSKLALMTNTTQRQISLYESGLQVADTTSLIKICKALNTSLDYLCGLSEYPLPQNEITELEAIILEIFRSISLDKKHFAISLLENIANHK